MKLYLDKSNENITSLFSIRNCIEMKNLGRISDAHKYMKWVFMWMEKNCVVGPIIRFRIVYKSQFMNLTFM